MIAVPAAATGRAAAATGLAAAEPPGDCELCPRLASLRRANAAAHSDWHNAPVTSFGGLDARLLVVGLAPGLKGANRTGRPFTGDFAGDLLYATLKDFGFAGGTYAARPDDGFSLIDCRVTNAVRCLPPENKPVGAEIANCRPYLTNEMAAMAALRVVLALGLVAHKAVLAALGHKQSARRFGHGALHELDGVTLANSYHCSRYNTNTGRLTPKMFGDVFAEVRALLDGGYTNGQKE